MKRKIEELNNARSNLLKKLKDDMQNEHSEAMKKQKEEFEHHNAESLLKQRKNLNREHAITTKSLETAISSSQTHNDDLLNLKKKLQEEFNQQKPRAINEQKRALDKQHEV